jgi:predicted DNA-binding transcriptional regulator AlpA
MHPHEYDETKGTPHAQPFEVLTQAEAAKLLGVSQRHLQRLEEIGAGPPRTRLGERRIAYLKQGSVAWALHRTTAPHPKPHSDNRAADSHREAQL